MSTTTRGRSSSKRACRMSPSAWIAQSPAWRARSGGQRASAKWVRSVPIAAREVSCTNGPTPSVPHWTTWQRQGVPVVPATVATDEAQAIAAAREFGGPVVLKIASADIPHKSDIGGVALNLGDERAVSAAFRRIMETCRMRAPNARLDGVLVSPMRERGIEAHRRSVA